MLPDYEFTNEVYWPRWYWPLLYLWWPVIREEDVLVTIDSVNVTCNLVYESIRVEQRADTFVSTAVFELIDEAGTLDIREKQEVIIEDGAHRYFAGHVANVVQRNMAKGPETLIWEIEAQDYNIMVEEVIIDQLEEYGGQLDSAIIDDLFDKYLPEINSHTPGGAPPGYVQSLHVFAEISFEAISLREALDRIASEVESVALEGYWYIDFYKFLHYFNVEDNAPAWSLSDVPDDVNSFAFSDEVRRARQGASITNRVLVVGAEMALFVQDYDSRDYYSRWYEGIVRDNTLFTVAEVMEHGYSILAKWAYPDESFEMSIQQTGLRAGMNVQLDCALFGTRTRTNRIINPSFEVNVLDGWAFVQDGAGGSAAQSGVQSAVGAFSCLLTASNAGNATQRSDSVVVQTGETVTVQVRTYRATDIGCTVEIWDVTNGVQRNSISPGQTATWEVLTASWTSPFAGPIDVQLRVHNTEGDAVGAFWFDACMFEIDKGPYPLEYVDGTLPYCSWTGVAHDSTSYRPPVYMVRQLVVTWPEETPTFALTLGGAVTGTALIKARLGADSRRRSVGPIADGQIPLCSRGWGHDLVFSSPDADTVAWTGGDIVTASGQTFTINAGNTGNITAATVGYVYFDIDTSLVNLQYTELGPPVGTNMILIAVVFPADDATFAMFTVFGGGDGGIGILIAHNNIAANTITGNEVAANTITAGEMNVGTLSAITANMGTLTAGTIQTAAAGNDRVVINIADGIRGIDALNVVQFQLDPADGKAYAGAGVVMLDEDGISITAGGGDINSYKWISGGNVVGAGYVNFVGVNATMGIYTLPGIAGASQIIIEAMDPGGAGTGVRLWADSAGAGSFTIDFAGATEMSMTGIWTRFASLGGGGNQDVGADNNGQLYVPFVSDARFKCNLEPIHGALEAICGLRGVSFDWNQEEVAELGLDFGDRRQVGFIAHEVEPHIPLAVSAPKGYQSVDVKKIVPYLVEAIKAQQRKIEMLEARI